MDLDLLPTFPDPCNGQHPRVPTPARPNGAGGPAQWHPLLLPFLLQEPPLPQRLKMPRFASHPPWGCIRARGLILANRTYRKALGKDVPGTRRLSGRKCLSWRGVCMSAMPGTAQPSVFGPRGRDAAGELSVAKWNVGKLEGTLVPSIRAEPL